MVTARRAGYSHEASWVSFQQLNPKYLSQTLLLEEKKAKFSELLKENPEQ